MGDRDQGMTTTAASRRDMTVIYAVMACVLFLLVIQFLMMMVSIDGFMAGSSRVVVPAAIGSGACFVAACCLIRFVAGARRPSDG